MQVKHLRNFPFAGEACLKETKYHICMVSHITWWMSMLSMHWRLGSFYPLLSEKKQWPESRCMESLILFIAGSLWHCGQLLSCRTHVFLVILLLVGRFFWEKTSAKDYGIMIWRNWTDAKMMIVSDLRMNCFTGHIFCAGPQKGSINSCNGQIQLETPQDLAQTRPKNHNLPVPHALQQQEGDHDEIGRWPWANFSIADGISEKLLQSHITWTKGCICKGGGRGGATRT